MNKIALVKKLLLLVSIVFFASCDKEFNTIGSDIVGDDFIEFEKESFEVIAKDTITGPVQTNNLTLNSLGIYNDPAFGTTSSHFVTQAELQISNVTVNSHPVVDSVWVYVPYFSTQTGTGSDGIREFELDSVYGGDQKFKLKVYENGYYLGNYNPDNENGIQRYFSDDKNRIENNKLGADSSNEPVLNGAYLNNSLMLSENEEFFFNNEERIIYKTDGNGQFVDAAGELLEDQGDVTKRVVKERFAPGIWLNLNKEYFRKRILEAPEEDLVNNNTFKEYFRGLYFQAEAINPGQGALASLDFSKGYIKITYNMDNVPDSPTATTTRLKRFLQLKLGGNCINFFDTNYTLPNDPAKLQLKGGNGSVAYIDLFDTTEDANDNNVPDDLDELRTKGWMINEANLVFYVDNVAMGHADQIEPNRIYVYDAKNKKPIADYYADGSTNGANPKLNKKGFGGIIEKDDSGNGIKYKVRITDHVKNLIKKDSTNYRLGVSVTESINVPTNAYLKPVSGQQPSKVVPLSSVISPLGTILHSPASTDFDKRLKLEIYYTKPD